MTIVEILIKKGQLNVRLPYLYDNDFRIGYWYLLLWNILYSSLNKALIFLFQYDSLSIKKPSFFVWPLTYFCKYFQFLLSCNVCMVCRQIFNSKLDLFKATCFIIYIVIFKFVNVLKKFEIWSAIDGSMGPGYDF